MGADPTEVSLRTYLRRKQHVVAVDRDAAITNIAVILYRNDMLKLPAPINPGDRLEPFLTLSQVVGIIADALDAAAVKGKRKR
jgi:predicted transcriptional regulator